MAASLGLAVDKEFCMGSCDKRTSAQEAEGSPSVEAIARKWLVQTIID
jgi:hypothetical protein